MTAVADPLVYAARPQFKLGGASQPALSDGLLALMVEETVAGLRQCEATFANWGPKDGATGFLYFDRQLFDFGTALVIEAGSGVGAGQIFEGKITALEGRFLRERPPELLVLAEDGLQELRMTRRTRTFESLSDSGLFNQVAGEYGLSAVVDVSGPTHKVLAQLNQSDLAFLRERARAVDAEIWIDGTSLHVQTRSSRNAGPAILTIGRSLFECSIVADLSGQVTGMVVSGWDVAAKQAISHRSAESVLGGELGQDLSGGGILARQFRTPDQQIVHHAPVTTAEATALADAHYRRVARRFVRASGSAEVDARLRVGARVELRGVGELFEGKYTVVRTRHLFDSVHGFRTEFEAERPGLGA
jgi:uncharacterized protein